MKTKEAPEKIYVCMPDDDIVGTASTQKGFPHQFVKEEYTRTDALIDKAVRYLNSKLYDWVQTTNPNQRSYANTIIKQDFIEDFKNYMKGE